METSVHYSVHKSTVKLASINFIFYYSTLLSGGWESVIVIVTDWIVWGSNPGGWNPYPSRLAPRLNQPRAFPEGKTPEAWR